MSEPQHLSEDELILFMDREIALDEVAAAERHLFKCRDCSERLRRLTLASNAYQDFQNEVLEPLLDVSVQGWDRPFKRSNRWMIWVVAASLCVLVFAVAYLSKSGEPGAEQVLTRAEAADYRNTGTIVIATDKYRLIRPAVLRTGTSDPRVGHIQALFVEARYSWDDPLSARSFAAWRRTLHRREDEVSSVVEPGGLKLYQVKTRTPDGVLRAASLTLKADTYQATRASFDFEGEGSLQMTQQTEVPLESPKPKSNSSEKMEVAVTPEEELRVFAALNAIGADAGDPIDIHLQPEHRSIVVTGMGLSDMRRKEVENALRGMTAVTLEFTSHSSAQFGRRSPVAEPEPDSGADNADMLFRQKLAVPFGGSTQLEAATDKALDSSNTLFARSHWLQLLARQFPPAIEAKLDANGKSELGSLRRKEIDSISLALLNLKVQLAPLVADSAGTQSSVMTNATWQAAANALFEDARNLDGLLSRLLAGHYTEEMGNNFLKQLPADLSKVESSLRSASSGVQ